MPDAAVAIVETRAQPESVLLIRRAERAEDPWSGHWSFPGGRAEPHDPDPMHTALRELEEECGIRLAPGQLEAAFAPTLARRRTGPFVLVAPFLFRVDGELPTVLDPREAAEARWIPLDLLRDPARHALRPVPGVPPHMLFPAIEFSDVPLWGFTYRLITDWLHLVPKEPLAAQAGFAAASQVLDFLLSHGLTLRRGWVDQAATVDGVIPVPEVLAHFSAPTPQIPMVNLVEVRPEYVCVVGLAFEKYYIYATAPVETSR
jgi:8-oxo-dGTP diphosphatase